MISKPPESRAEPSDEIARLSERVADLEQLLCLHERIVAEQSDAQRELESQLRQAQKMEALGRLAGGVAHDFNNILSVIISYSAMLLEDAKPSDPIRADLTQIRHAGLRATDLTRQLLAFGRKQILQPRHLNLDEVVADSERLLQRLLREDIQLRTVRGPSLRTTHVDPGQVEQILMNLVVNARDAITGAGKITIDTANVELKPEHVRRQVGVTPGAYVMLSVSDTGAGIDDETKARIFEPFFTTKVKGKGTGLGLATVFGIVKQSGGHIRVQSELGKGTTFAVYFPCSAQPPEAMARRTMTPSNVTRGSETILLVEDEETVRGLARTILTRHGYRVLEASSEGDALLICEQHEGDVDLLLTDVVMPRMNGRELSERLRTMRPRMKVLFMSGYTDDLIVRHGALEEGLALLQKPITPAALTRKVREVLDSPAPSRPEPERA